MKGILATILLFVSLAGFCQLPLRLPSVLSDHAVLQQNSEVNLWGWGPGGMKVAIVCSWNTQDTVWTEVTAECDWKAVVRTPSESGPHTIRFICEKQQIEISDILFGEVWLCSGQSNMEFKTKWDVEAEQSWNNNEIRFFQVNKSYDRFPQTDCEGEWIICTKEAIAEFSAVGYFFGEMLNKQLSTPVGLIGSYWGGTCIQAWMPREAFEKQPNLQKLAQNIDPYGWAPEGASVLFNSMIFPVSSYKISGVIWYQGEANVVRGPETYSELFMAMIKEWRTAFSSELPFYYVQIAPCSEYSGIDAAILREQQQKTLIISNTGMVSAADLVEDVDNIHPRKKRQVGERLANLALKEQYGKKDLQPYFPHFDQFTVIGNKAFVSVKSTGNLKCNEPEIANFQLAGDDRHFYPATATLQKDGQIQLVSPQVKNPVAVRYCFTNTAIPNLFDINGLPLLPFRTDEW